MKTIIAGSRDCNDYEQLLLAIGKSGFEVTEVVSGGCRGVDAMAEWWAKDWGKPCKIFPADWDKFGKSAGPIRNAQMADYAEALIAIWDGQSRGTKNMINVAKYAGLKVFVWKPNDRTE